MLTEAQVRRVIEVITEDALTEYAWRFLIQQGIRDEKQRLLAKLDKITEEVNRLSEDTPQ